MSSSTSNQNTVEQSSSSSSSSASASAAATAATATAAPARHTSFKDYTIENLQERLQYAKDILAHPNITPRTTIFMSEFKLQIEKTINATTDKDRRTFAHGVEALDKYIVEVRNMGYEAWDL
jgi:hypothetical protein